MNVIFKYDSQHTQSSIIMTISPMSLRDCCIPNHVFIREKSRIRPSNMVVKIFGSNKKLLKIVV